MLSDRDTIVAPATATGGAVAVVRVSGGRAIELCDNIFRGRTALAAAEGYTAHFGRIVDGERVVDEVVATLFRAPHSYTGEDSVEISCHGSGYIIGEVMRLLIDGGARMAEAGEFTVRAYLAGKLDLAQAEAVADLIASSSRAAHTMAVAQLRGGFSSRLDSLREELVRLASLVELELDFSEEDVEFADRTQLHDTMKHISEEVDRLRDSFALGNALKEGVAVAIVGAPNAGKSTLLNAMVGDDRAMVSEIAGTTRDVVEERVVIDGVVFRFLDTAGLRATDDRLERMGIERTRASIARAQIVLRVVDVAGIKGGVLPDAEFRAADNQTVIDVVNKIDMAPATALPGNAIAISARDGQGMEALRRALRAAIDTEELYHGGTVVSSSRHYEALTAARAALTTALAALADGLPTDLLAEDIREVIRHMAAITSRGTITPDEVLKSIFSKFCIGK